MITLMKQHVITTVMLAAIVSMAVSVLLVPRLAHAAFYYPAPTNYGALIAPATTSASADAEAIQLSAPVTVDIASNNTNQKASSVDVVKKHALTGAQVEAILNLLLAFGADKQVVDAVRLSLNN